MKMNENNGKQLKNWDDKALIFGAIISLFVLNHFIGFEYTILCGLAIIMVYLYKFTRGKK